MDAFPTVGYLRFPAWDSGFTVAARETPIAATRGTVGRSPR